MTVLEHPPGIIDFVVRQGASETYAIELFSDDAETIPQDLSGVTAIRMQVRRNVKQFAPDVTLTMDLTVGIKIGTRISPGEFDFTIATPAHGVIAFVFTPAMTTTPAMVAQRSVRGDTRIAREWVHDVEFSFGADVKRWLQGAFSLDLQVTE
jgi:hypothetical protein